MKQAMGDSPEQAAVLPRSRVVERIRSTPAGGVCLVASDPGYGRRTVVEAAHGGHAVTLGLGDPAMRGSELRAQIEGALAEVAAGEWLVLLDVSTSEQPDLVGTLGDLARTCLGDRRVAVVGSPDLAAACAPLRLEGLLVEVDQEDLSLSEDEGTRLLAAWVPDLGTEERHEIVRLCGGWLRALAAVRRQHHDRPDRDVLTWLRTYGAEMLVGRWLDAQQDDVRDMLLQTAILDRLTPDLVDAVTQTAIGWTLPALTHPGGQLRVSASGSDHRRVWFERHPLLTSLLGYRAGGGDSRARHRRAAEWFRGNGELGPELMHRLLAGDADVAVNRFEEVESEVLLSGQADLALRWYEQLPVTPVAANLLRVGWAHALSSRLPEAREVLYRLRRLPMDTSPDASFPDVGAEVDVLEAWLAERIGDIATTVTAAGRAHAVFGPSWRTSSHQLAVLLLARGRMLQGDVREADRLLASVRDNPFSAPVLGEGRRTDTEAEVAWADGSIHQARFWASRYDRWLRMQDAGRVHTRFLPSITGYLCSAEEGAYEEALAGLYRVADASEAAGATVERVLAHLAMAYLHRGRWQLSLAWEQAMLAHAAVLESSPQGGLLRQVVEAQVRIRLMSGDRVRAQRLLSGMGPSTVRQLLAARVALVRGLPSGVVFVREIEPTTIRQEVERLVLSAWAYSSTSRQRAEEDLLRAADLASLHGLSAALVDVPNSLLELGRRAAAYHVHEPLEGLIRAADDARSARLPRAAAAPASDLALTRGELELLALLPTRATYGGIAEQLGISINTVKTRLRRLYAKLGAPDRQSAISRAESLGLLP